MMKQLIWIIFLVFGCVHSDRDKSVLNQPESNSEIIVDTFFKINQETTRVTIREIVPDQWVVESGTIQNFRAIDTLDNKDSRWVYQFMDFSSDSIPSLMLTSNKSGFFISRLYQFDPPGVNFRKIEEFDSFPEAQLVKGQSNVFYSYRRIDCADLNWESDLFHILNNRAIRLAKIMVNNCGENPYEYENRSMTIFQNKNDSLVFIEKTSIDFEEETKEEL